MILSVDTETTGTDCWHGCRPFLVTMCDGRHNYYYQGKVNPLNRLDVDWDIDELEAIQDMLDSAQCLIFHNGKFDLHMLAHIGIQIKHLWEKIEDTMLASHCLSSGESHALKYLAFKYMDYFNEDERKLELAVQSARQKYKHYDTARQGHPSFPGIKGNKVSWYKMDYWLCPEECITYGLADVERTWGLWQIFDEALYKYELIEPYRKRLQLAKIAYQMECVGYNMYADEVRAEVERLSKLRQEMHDKIKDECYIGGNFDLTKEDSLRLFLFSALKLQPTLYTEKRGTPSISKEAIDMMIEENPNISQLQDFQTYRTSGTQMNYLKQYLDWACDDGRIRSNIFITGTRETRQSYTDPNLQNIDKKLRHVFGPPPGKVWIDFDLVNIEMRIWVYEVQSPELLEVFESGGSVHMLVAEIIHPKLIQECKENGTSFKTLYESTWYQWVKNGNFAIIYGASGKTADRSYKVKGAYDLIAKRFPQVPAYSARIIKEMQLNHEKYHWPHVTCYGGYKLDVNPDEPFKAVNYKIQGSAGWFITEAMIALSMCHDYISNGAQMVQQVHDSIVIEVDEAKYSESLCNSFKRTIESCVLKYLPTGEASYKVIRNEQPPF